MLYIRKTNVYGCKITTRGQTELYSNLVFMQKSFVLCQKQSQSSASQKSLLKLETEGKTFTYKMSAGNHSLHATTSEDCASGVLQHNGHAGVFDYI